MSRRTRGPGAHHQQRRTEIADAVLAVVSEQGLAAVSQSEVAARAGVSPGRIQHYFPAKQELIEAAFDRGNALSSARIAAKTAQDAPVREALTIVLTELIPHDDVTRAHMRIRQSFTAAALADEAIAARMRVDYTRFHRQIAALLRDGGAADPEATAVALIALAEGLAYYVLIGVSTPEAARDRVLIAIADAWPPNRRPTASADQCI